MLVEDNPRDAELALLALAKCKLLNEVVHVRDGAQALDYLKREGDFAERVDVDPVVVLLDLKLPKVDGLEVLEAVRGDASVARVPVVMLTSSAVETDLIRSYELGVNAFVVKPLDFGDFLSAIQSLGFFWGIANQTPMRGGIST